MLTGNAASQAAKELRIGLLGCGFMGKCHTNAYKKIPYIYPTAKIKPRLAVLCDAKAELAEQEAARYGYEAFCTDWQQLAADPRIDVLDNCCPDPLHPEPCIAALKQGKHVICEKPMAVSVEAARRMRDAAAVATGKSMCTFNYRFMPAVRLAKDLITEGRLGKIYHFRIHYLQMWGHDPSLPPEKSWASAWPHSGALQGIGSHAIDQCCFLVGEIASVSALARAFQKERALPSVGCPPEITSDEGNAALLDFENGAIGVLESSVVATGRKNALVWEINGSHGSLRWDLEHPNSLFACLATPGDNRLLGFTEISATESIHPYMEPWWPSGHNLGWEHGQIIEKFHFLDAVAHDKPLSPYNATFEDGYRVAVIIDAMRKSSRTGQRVPVVF
ncbi:MAG: Gfo/Idh/MocA family oxidoreductase [Planctomycetota bacterium]